VQDLEHNLFSIVDILASEYGWTIEYIQSLDFGEVNALLKQIAARIEKSRGKDFSLKNEKEALEQLISDGIAQRT